ncbi:MAG TPA: VWA domain-containing protein [Thermoanaerobaculia bacterium]|nr:VWA domain-containing protein [Thermoanaerobaculia bacterium]
MWRRTAVVLVLFLPLASFSQQQQQSQTYGERMDVRIRNLDVVVNDRGGKAVRGLTKDDFVVIEDGVEQAITNFAFYDSDATVSADFATTIGAPAGSAEPPPPRRFLFFIDEMAVHAPARKTLKKHAAEIVAQMKPGDIATVVRPTGATRIVQDYTGDVEAVRKSLEKAIDDCKISITSPAYAEFRMFRRELETSTNPNEVANAKRNFAERETARVTHRLGQIRALLASLGRESGRKVFVLLTSGLSAQPGRAAYSFEEELKLNEAPGSREARDSRQLNNEALAEQGGPGALMAALTASIEIQLPEARWTGMDRQEYGDVRSQIDAMARAAAADGITIYALEPEVPLIVDFSRGADGGTTGSTQLGGRTNTAYSLPPEMLNHLLFYEGQTLTSLTEKTGGKWFRGVGAIDDVFRQMSDDLRTYYSIAYRPQGEEGKLRKIKVKVRNRPELVVRTRTEVIDQPEARDMADRVLAGLLYPHHEDSLQMIVKTDKPEKQGKQFGIPLEIVIPVEQLSFTQAQDGTYRAVVNVHYAAARDDKELLSYGQQEQIVELSAAQYAHRNRGRYRYQSTISVPKGNIKIALGVVDTSTKQASLQTVTVTTR